MSPAVRGGEEHNDEAHMATIILTVAEYDAAAKPFAAADDVTIADLGLNIDGLTPAQIAAFARNGVDFIDVTNNLMVLSTSQYEALGTVGLTASDTIILKDTGAELGSGTIAQVSGLLGRNVDRIDVADNVVPFSVAQLAVLQVPLSQSDVIILTDRGTTISKLTPAQIGALASEGVTRIDATNNALTLSEAQFAALGPVKLTGLDVVTRLGSTRNDKMTGTAFDDILQGGIGNDVLMSGARAHTLMGGTGKDRLIGSAFNDKLHGGQGNDSMTGGKGRDAFFFDTKAIKANLDKILDYNVRDDSVYLDNAFFRKLGKGTPTKPLKLNKEFFALDKPKDADDFLIYNKKNGVLYYDDDGSGAGRAVGIAVLGKNLKLDHGEFYVI
jgi:Ca2+-binding RTX toxin-like protein